jgi:type III secretory pathway component EscU
VQKPEEGAGEIRFAKGQTQRKIKDFNLRENLKKSPLVYRKFTHLKTKILPDCSEPKCI